MAQATQEAQNQSSKKLIEMDISTESYREYEWTCPVKGTRVAYRIGNPAKVYFYNGCTTHRVVDKDGVAHCVPSIGYYGCVLRWKNEKGPPVNF